MFCSAFTGSSSVDSWHADIGEDLNDGLYTEIYMARVCQGLL